jgi:hypothetical protein
MGRKEGRKSVEGSLVLGGAFSPRSVFFVELRLKLFRVKRSARDLRQRLLEFTFLGR